MWRNNLDIKAVSFFLDCIHCAMFSCNFFLIVQGRIQDFWLGGSIWSIYLTFLKIPHDYEIIWNQRGVRANPLNPLWIRHCSLNGSRSDHMISIFGSNVLLPVKWRLTIGVFCVTIPAKLEWFWGNRRSPSKRSDSKPVAQEGNNCSPEDQLAQGINIIRNSKRPLVELLKLLELKSKPVSAQQKRPIRKYFGTQ